MPSRHVVARRACDAESRYAAGEPLTVIHPAGCHVVKGEERDHRAWPIHRLSEPDAAPVVSRGGRAAFSRAPEDQSRDLTLMRRVGAGDDDALAALYDAYAAQVNGLARSILRDPALSEEVTHDVFLRIWQQPAAYDPARGTFAGWVSRVARNRAIGLLRQRRETSLGDAEEDPLLRVPDPDPDPAEQTMARLHRQEVRQALDHLPPEQRQVLELAFYTGLTQRQIAERLGRPLGTVKSQIRTAMRRLADRLAAPEHPSKNSPATGTPRTPPEEPA